MADIASKSEPESSFKVIALASSLLAILGVAEAHFVFYWLFGVLLPALPSCALAAWLFVANFGIRAAEVADHRSHWTLYVPGQAIMYAFALLWVAHYAPSVSWPLLAR